MQYALMVLVGLVTGVVAGLFGIGGGLILIPFLVLGLRYSQQTANGTSLVALLLPVGLLGVIQYYKAGRISYEHIRYGLTIAVGLFAGTYFGGKWANLIPETLLRKSFALFLVVVAVRMWMLERA